MSDPLPSSARAPAQCRWDWCRVTFRTRAELNHHIKEDHVKPMQPMRKAEIIQMIKRDKERVLGSATTDASTLPADNSTRTESPSQVESPARLSLQSQHLIQSGSGSLGWLPSRSSAKTPQTLDLMSRIRHDSPGPVERGVFERKHKPNFESPSSSQDAIEVVEQQLTQDSSEHAVNDKEQSAHAHTSDADLPWPSAMGGANGGSCLPDDPMALSNPSVTLSQSSVDRGSKFLTGRMPVPSVRLSATNDSSGLSGNQGFTRTVQSFMPQTQATYSSQSMDSSQSQ